jgi:hypothetical protein
VPASNRNPAPPHHYSAAWRSPSIPLRLIAGECSYAPRTYFSQTLVPHHTQAEALDANRTFARIEFMVSRAAAVAGDGWLLVRAMHSSSNPRDRSLEV